MFAKRLSLKDTVEWTRSLSSTLRAGLGVTDAFRIAGKRGRPRVRRISNEVYEHLKDGEDIGTALDRSTVTVPKLLRTLCDVAGHTGHLPEVMAKLEEYYRFQMRLRRQFLSQIFWPVFQLVAAILVIAVVILILGIIAGSQKQGSIDFLGLGLQGTAGALVWLGGWFGSFALLAFLYWFFKTVRQSSWVDSLLLRIPVLGQSLRLLAMSRLCFAMRITMDTGMPILQALRLSLEASENGVFRSLTSTIQGDIRKGRTLAESFSSHHVFPEEFLVVLDTAEQSGSVPEAMERLSAQYNEQAEIQLSILNTAAGWLVWLLVAIIILMLVIRIFMSYVSILNDAVKGL